MMPGPSVAVQFVGIPRGQLIHVVCKLWFKNVVHDSNSALGLVKFGVMLDQGTS